jgi:hypothetical protein
VTNRWPGGYGYVVSDVGNPKVPPRPYPDNVKLIKRIVVSSIVYLAIALPVSIAVTVVLGPGRPQWINIALTVTVACGVLAVQMWAGRSWQKEDLQRRRDLQRLRAGVEPAPAPDTDPPPRSTNPLRATPKRRLMIAVVLTLGLPLTIVGAVSNIPGLLIAGLVLLLAQLIDTAVVLPFLHRRQDV